MTNSPDDLLMPKFSPVIYLPTKCCERLIAIGDIHGCYEELIDLLQLVQPTPKDCLVFLGDLVDRGPDSGPVLDYVMGIQKDPLTIKRETQQTYYSN